MRGRSFVQLTLLGLLVAGGVTAVALAIPWLPAAASKERDRIDVVFWVTTGIAIFIFSLVVSVILYSVVKFRARPDDDTDGPPIHGHTGLEIAWTAVPTALVTAIAILSAIVLHDNGQAGNDPLRVTVIAQQFSWSFRYDNGPARGVTAPVLRLPLERKARLAITTKDVIHSFWVPEFGQKQDAVPGEVNPLVITPTKLSPPDGWPVICTELCGLGHSLMRSQAIVMTPQAFDRWARQARQPTGGPPSGGGRPSGGGQAAGAALGRRVFAASGCGSCHTLRAAGATGTVGPDLDKLQAEAKRAGQPLESFVRESIVNPGAYVEPKYPNGVMPTTFGQSIPKAQLDALVQFLVQSAKSSGG